MTDRELLSRSSLAVATQWVTWLRHQLDTLQFANGRERLLRDTIIVCHHNLLNCARRLRGNPGWSVQGSMRDDTVNLHTEILEARAYYLRNRPNFTRSLDRLSGVFEIMDGLVNQQVRLAREIQELHETGALAISVTTDRQTASVIRQPEIVEELHN